MVIYHDSGFFINFRFRLFEQTGYGMAEQNYSNILVVAPSWIGDMVMAQSLLMRLKEQYPGCRITVFAPGWCLALLERMPQIDETVPNPFGHGQLRISDRLKTARELAQRKFDLALVLPHSIKSALIPFFARIPVRRGWIGEQRYFLLNQIYRDKGALPLLVEQYNALAFSPKGFSPDSVRGYPYPSLEVHRENIPSILEKFHVPYSDNVLGLCPGAEYGPAKRWPAEYFAGAASEWIKRGGSVHIFGGPKDVPLSEEIRGYLDTRQQNFCHILSGKTTLPEVADLLSGCRGVITNDSGLMHVSAAAGVPLVAVYGSSTTGYTPPLSKRAKALFLTDLKCRPCFKRTCPLEHTRCLKEITPEMVIKELDLLLSNCGE